jgi:alpha-tubulin suppressor-like RCC1 family protein
MSSGAALALLVTLLVVLTPVPPTAADGNEAPGKPFVTRSITAGSTHTCVLVHSARVKCWGRNNFGQLGLGDTTSRGDGAGEMGDDLPTVNLGTGRTATALTSGESHTCALLDNGTVKCWGKNDVGQLGLGDTASRGDGAGEMGDSLPPVSLGAGRTATAITAGDNHTCARLDNGTVKCWGNNTNGRLGLGDVAARGDAAGEMGDSLPAVALGTGRTARAVSAGSGQTCALLDNAAVKCWGANGFGQLGLGDALAHGSGAGEMGDNLPTVDLGTGRTATAITAGVLHTCALLDNGTVKCWGNSASGQLGLEDVATRGDAGGEMGDSLPSVPLGRDVVAVTAGNSHNCALLDNGDVKCWGNNQFGQLGLGDVANRGDAAGEMGGNLPTIELGGFRTVVAVDAGSAHTCALLDNGSIKCWGENSNGTLGLGSETDRGDAAGEMGDNLPTVNLGTGRTATAITAGGGYTCALLDNATVKCWGLNSHGQLGLGDVATRGDDLGETGDNLPTVDLGTGRTATAITAGANHTCARLDNATLKCWGNNSAGAAWGCARRDGRQPPRRRPRHRADPGRRRCGARLHLRGVDGRRREVLGEQRRRANRLRRHRRPR